MGRDRESINKKLKQLMKNRIDQKRTFTHLAGAILALTLSAHAAVYDWTNASGGSWNNPTNWTPNQVPGSNDTANITVAGTYSVTLNVSPTVAGLVLGASNGLTTQSFFTGGQTL